MWGIFPEQTSTEILVESDLLGRCPPQIKKNLLTPQKIEESIQIAKQEYFKGNTKTAESIIYETIKANLHKRSVTKMSPIGKEGIVGMLSPTTAFSLSIQALREKNYKALRWLIERSGVEILLKPNLTSFQEEETQETLSHMAARLGDDKALETIMELGTLKTWIDKEDINGNTPAMTAASHWRAKCLEILLKTPSNTKQTVTKKNSQGESILKTEMVLKRKLHKRKEAALFEQTI